ncbi:protease modulator HflC [Myxococcota bacterium]|nr:protease modulator HflC [Myxococcota bacterium]
MRFLFALLVVGAAVVALLWASQIDRGPLVINRADEYRLVLRKFGEPVELKEAGVAGMWGPRIPFLDTVLVFDKKIQYLSAAATEVEIESHDRVIIDYYVLWKIESPLAFRSSFPAGIPAAQERIQKTVGSLVGNAVGTLSMQALLSRAGALDALSARATEEMAADGVRVIDVRINRTELPIASEKSTYDQMREQRRAIAREKRARGEREGREIRAKAEREARAILAEANAAAQVTRGAGDAEAARIYAAAYGKDPEFFAFTRSLEAYRRSLGEKTSLFLSPEHEFFRYFESSARPR